eukprot:TRINITY_DN919_c10_g1_i1.p1 TRINITY_DN919_c10_g1~~TRINITY_DN919_c10_g1_i1.p1  ORF type:complete len:248 (+),score=56.10 TRINITY_DN919_c10_g1_i1:34-777(+)
MHSQQPTDPRQRMPGDVPQHHADDEEVTLCVMGLPSNFTERELFWMFATFPGYCCGNIGYCGGSGNGPLAFVTFASKDEAETALTRVNGLNWEPQKIRIRVEFSYNACRNVRRDGSVTSTKNHHHGPPGRVPNHATPPWCPPVGQSQAAFYGFSYHHQVAAVIHPQTNDIQQQPYYYQHQFQQQRVPAHYHTHCPYAIPPPMPMKRNDEQEAWITPEGHNDSNSNHYPDNVSEANEQKSEPQLSSST